jgi:hypothetical protein
MSAVGRSRHIAPPLDLGRQRGTAETDRYPSIEEGDVVEPERQLRNVCYSSAVRA